MHTAAATAVNVVSVTSQGGSVELRQTVGVRETYGGLLSAFRSVLDFDTPEGIPL